MSRGRRRPGMPNLRLGAAARIVVGVLLLAGVLFLGVFPTRTYLDQRESIDNARDRRSVLRTENDRLRERIESLRSEEVIERIAREQYNLAKPGEEVYVVIPSAMESVRRYGGPDQVVDAIRRAWGVPLPE